MQNITIERTVAASPADVWAVLADFANIASWNSGVATSYATSDAVDGVGAQRHCDLAPMGTLEETIAEWVPHQKMVVTIDKATRIPIENGVVTFTLGDDPAGAGTPFTLSYDYRAKGGLLAPIIGSLLAGRLRAGFAGFVDDLETAAQARATN